MKETELFSPLKHPFTQAGYEVRQVERDWDLLEKRGLCHRRCLFTNVPKDVRAAVREERGADILEDATRTEPVSVTLQGEPQQPR